MQTFETEKTLYLEFSEVMTHYNRVHHPKLRESALDYLFSETSFKKRTDASLSYAKKQIEENFVAQFRNFFEWQEMDSKEFDFIEKSTKEAITKIDKEMQKRGLDLGNIDKTIFNRLGLTIYKNWKMEYVKGLTKEEIASMSKEWEDTVIQLESEINTVNAETLKYTIDEISNQVHAGSKELREFFLNFVDECELELDCRYFEKGLQHTELIESDMIEYYFQKLESRQWKISDEDSRENRFYNAFLMYSQKIGDESLIKKLENCKDKPSAYEEYCNQIEEWENEDEKKEQQLGYEEYKHDLQLSDDYEIKEENEETHFLIDYLGIEIIDHGEVIQSSPSLDMKEECISIVVIAQAKGWDISKLKIDGSAEFKAAMDIEIKIKLTEKSGTERVDAALAEIEERKNTVSLSS